MTSFRPRPSTADRALLRARLAWGRPADEGIWDRFGPRWRDRLRAASTSEPSERTGPGAARAALRLEHEAEARPDFARIHPSWLVRALEHESPAVRLAVATHAPPEIAEALRAAEGPRDVLEEGRPPHPIALRLALALWTERLVGGPSERDDDPPIVRALTRLRFPSLFRLVAVIGQAKRSLVIGEAGPGRDPQGGPPAHRPRASRRLAHFRNLWADPDPRLVALARFDLQDAGPGGDPSPARLGLVTVGRLLAIAEPHRARWALQHLPYGVAKLIRSRMSLKQPILPAATLAAWEAGVLLAVLDLLKAEGCLGREDLAGGLA